MFVCLVLSLDLFLFLSNPYSLPPSSFLCLPYFRGRGSSAVRRATPGEEIPGSIPAVAAYWLGRCQYSAKLHQSRTARMARRNTCFLSLPMDATVQHCPATVPAVTRIDRPKLGQRRSSGHTVHTTDEARTALRLSKLRSIKILYTLTMIYDSLYI